MRKILLSIAALSALCVPAASQPYGQGIGPGVAPCAYTNCTVTTLTATSQASTGALIFGTLGYVQSSGIATAAFMSKVFQLRGDSGSALAFSVDGNPGNTAATLISSKTTANLQFGAFDAAAPVAQTLSFQSVVAGTSNVAGANTIINLSVGTGTGIGGNLTINGAPHSTTGSTQNAISPILTLNGDTRAIGMPGLASSSAAQTGTVCWTTGTGNLTVDTTTTCLLSLEEFKNIKGGINSAGALAEVLKLKPIWFSYKPGHAAGDLRVHAGLGAHQVEGVDRRLVGYDPQGKLTGVRYADSITSLNVAAIQELTSQLEALKAKVAALEHRK